MALGKFSIAQYDAMNHFHLLFDTLSMIYLIQLNLSQIQMIEKRPFTF